VAKKTVAPVENDRIRLRLLAEEDLEQTLSWRNQDDIRKWFFFQDRIEPANHRAWFEKYQARDNDFVFIIEAKDLDGIPIGQIALYDIDWEQRRGEYGRLMIGEPAAKGKGYAQDATQLVLEVAAEQFGLKEVYLEVYTHNQAARRVYEKSGFIVTESGPEVTKMSYFTHHD